MQKSVFFVLIDCYEADDPDTGDCLGLFLKKIFHNIVGLYIPAWGLGAVCIFQ